MSSEFHTAFYRNCPVHKDVEHPLWRKCPKCSEVITYSEEEVLNLLWKIVGESNDPQYTIQRSGNRLSMTKSFPTNNWFETNKKK